MFGGKQSAFETQFHLIVVSIFLKTCEKNHGDTSTAQLIARKKDLIGRYGGALVSGFLNILVFFNK